MSFAFPNHIMNHGSYHRDEESDSLLNNGPSQHERAQETDKKQFSIYFKTFAAITVALVVFLMVSMTPSGSSGHSSEISLSETSTYNKAQASTYEIKIRVKTSDYDEPKSLENLPWDAIAEPYKKNKVSVKSFEVNGKSLNVGTLAGAVTYKWIIDGTVYEDVPDVTFQVDRTGILDCLLSIKTIADIGSTPAGTEFVTSFKVANKYVRREIRSLKEADRKAFFAALKQMYTVDQTVGKSLYGEKFSNAEHFLYLHLAGAATSDCDHWHDGAGIVTHHTAITLAMEQSLQAINPALAMPYWEYGMDALLYSNFQESPIFGADWYGEASPANPEHKLNDGGLWSGVVLPSGAKYLDWDMSKTGSLRPFVNAYGQLRSPWNNNPSPYIGRHAQIYGKSIYKAAPSCSLFQACYQSTSLGDIFQCLNGRTHGPVHIMIGGAWGEGETLADSEVSMFQNPDKLLLFKVLWRMGLTRCPETCAAGAACKCAVPDLYLKQFGAKEILRMSGILQAFDSDFGSASDATLLKVLRALEDPGVVGEMYSSAASFDPTFWPLHGAAERLVSLKRARISAGTLHAKFDETWSYPSFTSATLSAGAYLDGTCDWSGVKGVSDLTLPTCTTGGWCSGHNEADLLEFGNFLNKGETYTNGQMYQFMHPWNEALPYTYDTFDYDYCTEKGYDFDDYSGGGRKGVPPELEAAVKGGETSGM